MNSALVNHDGFLAHVLTDELVKKSLDGPLTVWNAIAGRKAATPLRSFIFRGDTKLATYHAESGEYVKR